MTTWFVWQPPDPEHPTEYDRYVKAGPTFASAWKIMEEKMMPPSWEVFWDGLNAEKKRLGKPLSANSYAKMVVLWGERD